MKFLVENGLSPQIAVALRHAGHDAIHVREEGLQAASDDVLFKKATDEQRNVVTVDMDFGAILAQRRTSGPSVVLFRRDSVYRPADQIRLLLINLPSFVEALEAGSIVVLEEGRIRIRPLPID